MVWLTRDCSHWYVWRKDIISALTWCGRHISLTTHTHMYRRNILLNSIRPECVKAKASGHTCENAHTHMHTHMSHTIHIYKLALANQHAWTGAMRLSREFQQGWKDMHRWTTGRATISHKYRIWSWRLEVVSVCAYMCEYVQCKRCILFNSMWHRIISKESISCVCLGDMH